MKTSTELNARKAPIVRTDATLEQYRNQVLFPAKLAKANEVLGTIKLPARPKVSR